MRIGRTVAVIEAAPLGLVELGSGPSDAVRLGEANAEAQPRGSEIVAEVVPRPLEVVA